MANVEAESDGPWYTHLFGWLSAALVVMASVGFVFVLLFILYIQLDAIEHSAKVTPISSDIMKIDPDLSVEKLELIGQLYMESDAQFLRTERAQSLVAARLTVMIVAELVGLSLIVLGGAFIFARIRGSSSLEVDGGLPDKASRYSLVSNFPGLFLCGFGAVVVIWALEVSVSDNARITTGDRPLFFPSESFKVGVFAEKDPAADTEAAKISVEICRKNAPDPSKCPEMPP